MKTIYFAGGCFWGLEKYLSLINGVQSTQAGYANGTTQNPDYKQVCTGQTGYAETVKTVYNENIIPLEFLLQMFFMAIDPTTLNMQGGDTGTQYRTGVYYEDEADEKTIKTELERLAQKYENPIVVECLPLSGYYTAEEYHQKYLDKNPGGYCHLGRQNFEKAMSARVVTNSQSGQKELVFGQ